MSDTNNLPEQSVIAQDQATDRDIPESWIKPVHPKPIFAVERDFITKGLGCKQGLNVFTKDVLTKFEPHVIIKRRRSLEKDRRLLQLLPYYVFLRKNEQGQVTQAYFYRREKTVGEERLAGNYSLGWGGHVEISSLELDADGSFDIPAIIKANTCEELEQELGMTEEDVERLIELRGEFQGLLLDFSNDVGNVHLGLVSVVVLDHDEDFAFKSKEDELTNVGWIDIQGMLSPENTQMFSETENWSQIVLNHLVLKYIVGAGDEQIQAVVNKFDQMATHTGLHVTAEHSDVMIPQLGLDEHTSEKVLGFAISVAMGVVGEVAVKVMEHMPTKTAEEVRSLAAVNLELYYKHADTIRNELQRNPA